MEAHTFEQFVSAPKSDDFSLDFFIKYFASGEIDQFYVIVLVQHNVARL